MARRRGKRKHPWNKGRKFHKGPKRKHGRKHWISNPGHHRKHKRHHSHRRHRNPMGALTSVAIAAVAGIGASIAAAMALDAAWPTGTSQQKSWALLGLAGATAYFFGRKHPTLAAGIATGMVLVPGQQLVAGFLQPAPAQTAALYSNVHSAQLGALHDSREAALAASDDALLRSRGLI